MREELSFTSRIGERGGRRRQASVRAAGERERAAQVVGERVDDGAHAGLAARRQAPRVRPADEHGVGAERERAQDVGAVADPAVDEHRHPAGDGRGDLAQRDGGRHAAVELAAAVVGDDDRVGAGVERRVGVLGAQERP